MTNWDLTRTFTSPQEIRWDAFGVCVMSDDAWAPLADQFVDEAQASVKGQVRTYTLHHHLMDHLEKPPAAILDVGGGAGRREPYRHLSRVFHLVGRSRRDTRTVR